MIPLTPEQREYKEKTLHHLLENRAQLEATVENATEPRQVKSIQRQLSDVDGHISRLQDELSGSVIIDEPVADELFKKAAEALTKGKFFLAKRKINKLETIEPFYPGIGRLKQEAETQQVSRRTRSIAEGKATGYPGLPALPDLPTSVGPIGQPTDALALRPPRALPGPAPVEEGLPWWRNLFQFHIVVSCLVVVLLLCVVFSLAGFTILQWLVEGA